MAGTALEKAPELLLQRRQQPGKADAAGGKIGGKVLGQGLAPAEQPGTGVVEGVVGVGVMGLPAIGPEGAVAADLLRRAVEQHGRVFGPEGRGFGGQAVVHRLKGGRRGGGHIRGGQAGCRRGGQQQVHAAGHQQLAQQGQGLHIPQQPRAAYAAGAERGGGQDGRQGTGGGIGCGG